MSGCFKYCLEYADLSTIISSDLIHPDIDHDYISDRQRKKGNLSFIYSGFVRSLNRIESFSIYDVEFAWILVPDPFSTSLTGFACI